MSTTSMSFRVDKNLKEDADKLFKSLGLNTSTALNMFLTQSVKEQGLPFISSNTINNKKMLKALKEAELIESGELNPVIYDNFDEYMRDHK